MISKEQKKLIGHDKIFNEFCDIFKNSNFPSKLILSGKKGIGKSVLAYHFINYIFSLNEDYKYNLLKNEINPNNKSYKLINNRSHPNFFNIDVIEGKKNIDIFQIRQMISFINKSSFNNLHKIILIDNVESLNLNSANALLKVLEEPNKKVIFFLIHDNEKKIIDTINSRCIKFKIQITETSTEDIVNNYFGENIYLNISKDFKYYFNTPSIYINFVKLCKDFELDYFNIEIEDFLKFIIKNNLYKKYDVKKYVDLLFKKKLDTSSNYKFISLYNFFNSKFHNVLKFNLDMETYYLELNSKILNE